MSELAIVQKAHDLFDRGLDRSEIREELIQSPVADIVDWFEAQGVGYLLGQVDSRRRRFALPTPSYQPPAAFDSDGVQIPLVDIPPLVNSEGETLPSKLTTAYAESKAVRWAKTVQWEGRYLWDAANDIDWLLVKIDANRRKADGIRKTTDLIEGLVGDLKSGMTKEEALATLMEGWSK